jgi:hypothetical protein
MRPSSHRHGSILPPSNSCFLREPNLDSRNGNLNPEIVSKVTGHRNLRGVYSAAPANLDSTDYQHQAGVNSFHETADQ